MSLLRNPYFRHFFYISILDQDYMDHKFPNLLILLLSLSHPVTIERGRKASREVGKSLSMVQFSHIIWVFESPSGIILVNGRSNRLLICPGRILTFLMMLTPWSYISSLQPSVYAYHPYPILQSLLAPSGMGVDYVRMTQLQHRLVVVPMSRVSLVVSVLLAWSGVPERCDKWCACQSARLLDDARLVILSRISSLRCPPFPSGHRYGRWEYDGWE